MHFDYLETLRSVVYLAWTNIDLDISIFYREFGIKYVKQKGNINHRLMIVSKMVKTLKDTKERAISIFITTGNVYRKSLLYRELLYDNFYYYWIRSNSLLSKSHFLRCSSLSCRLPPPTCSSGISKEKDEKDVKTHKFTATIHLLTITLLGPMARLTLLKWQIYVFTI